MLEAMQSCTMTAGSEGREHKKMKCETVFADSGQQRKRDQHCNESGTCS